jgi:cell division septation protein DedD
MSSDPTDYESPRQRRERIFVRKRSRRRFVLIGAAILLFVFAGGVWALYYPKRGPVTSAEVPLLRADEQPTRKRPADAGGMTVPDRDSLVLNRAEPSVEQLLPPPETPLPRPAPAEPPGAEPTPPPQAAAAPPPAAAPPAEQPKAPTTPAAAAPAPSPPSAAAAPSAAAPPAAPEPKPEQKMARAAAPPPPAPIAGKGYRLQLGSVRSAEAAKKEWDHLRSEQSDLLGAMGFTAERADLGARGIYYRIQAGPIADAATAEHDCNELKKRGVGCILVKP